jgi:putative ABC transport system permease protein
MVKLVRALDMKLVRDLWRIRGQALAIAAVIACGVATVVMAFGVQLSLTEIRDAYYDRYRFADVFARLERAPEYIKSELEGIPGVHSVDIRVVEDVTLEIEGYERPVSGRLVSLPDREGEGLNAITLRWGRLPAPGRLDEAVVSEAFAEAHALEPGGFVRAKMNGRVRDLKLVGVGLSPEYVYIMGVGQLVPDNKSFGVLWLDHDALEGAFDLRNAFNDVSLDIMHGAKERDVIASVDRVLERFGALGAYGRDDQTSHAFLTAELDQLGAMGRIIPPVFLAVAAFLLYVVIARLIDTEREQIGLLKAFGYSNAAIGWHYAKFVAAITGLGVLLGIAFGAWLGAAITELYTMFFRFPFLYYRMDLGVFVMGAAVSFAAAAVGTALAVMKAVRLPPAVAMRPPAPALYHRSLTETIGIARLLSPSARMVIRHLERWPVRALMTVAGVAASITLLIGTTFMFDAIEQVIGVFYFRTLRHDVQVTYFNERDERALYEIGRLPGVLAAESFRAVPVRVKFGHREERTGILGVPPNPRLYQLYDVALRPISVPPQGLLLSTTLANELLAKPGDDVSIETLIGERRKATVKVAAIANEYVGMSAYMSIEALNRLMQEGRVDSGAYLLTDPRQTERLYSALKKTPGVAGLTIKRSAVESFRNTFAQSMTTVLFFYVGFAGMITFGVVYNAARITLSERARDLATLRVLGFSKSETAAILLGEFALLTLAAIPLGWLLGYGMANYMVERFATELYRIPLVVTWGTLSFAAITAISAAVLSGALVARRINNLDLVAVLKTRD